MKMTVLAVGLLTSVVAWGLPVAPALAAQEAPVVAGASDEVEHEALRQMRAIYEQAIRDNRLDALAPFLHQDFKGVMVTGRDVTGLNGLKGYWSDIQALIGEGGRYTTTLKPELSVLLGDVALARGSSDDVVVTSDGQEFRFTSLWSAVLQKEGGQWKLRQAQGTIDPVDNPFVREFTRRAVMGAGAVGAGGGVLLGWGIAWFFGRRKRA
jgi:ketosteroid isomerase-like protein